MGLHRFGGFGHLSVLSLQSLKPLLQMRFLLRARFLFTDEISFSLGVPSSYKSGNHFGKQFGSFLGS